MIVLVLIGLIAVQEPDVDSLLKQLENESIEVREKAAAALVAMGDKVEERIRKQLDTATPALKPRFEGILSAIARNRRLGAVLPPLKRVSMAPKDAALKDAVEDLSRQSGLKLHLDGAADARVTFEVKDATPFEALLALCRAGKLSFEPEAVQMRNARDLGKDPVVWLSLEGYRDVPRQVGRHYLIEAQSVEVKSQTQGDKTIKTAQLTVCARWLPDVKPDIVAVDVTYVKDDKGRPLFQLDSKGPRMSDLVTHKADARTRSQLHRIPLRSPSKEAKALAFIKGVVTAKYAVGDLTLAFNAPADEVGQSRESDQLAITLKSFKAGVNDCQVEIAVGWAGSDPNLDSRGPATLSGGQVRVRLQDGTTREPDGFTDNNSNKSLTFNRLASKVVAVEIVLGPVYHEDKFEFELKDVPLPK